MSKSFLASMTSALSVSDEQLMWRVRTRDDHEAFERLVRKWQPPVLRLCARMTGDIYRGQDLAQETFVKLFARRKDYETTGKFSSYLWRITLNVCHDELRRLKRSGEIADFGEGENSVLALTPSREKSPDAQLGAKERVEEVREALLRLPERFRTVLILRHYEDLKFREIAEVMNIPEGTVKSRMVEALNQMAHLLKITPAKVLSRKSELKAQSPKTVTT